MIVGSKENVPNITNTVPEQIVDVKWTKDQNWDSWKTLKNCGFRVRVIVSDNYSANMLAYKPLLKEFIHLDDDLYIEHNYQKIYLLHDAVHLILIVRNNLLNYKRVTFFENNFVATLMYVRLNGGHGLLNFTTPLDQFPFFKVLIILSWHILQPSPLKKVGGKSKRFFKKVRWILTPCPPNKKEILKNLSEMSPNFLMDLQENFKRNGKNITSVYENP